MHIHFRMKYIPGTNNSRIINLKDKTAELRDQTIERQPETEIGLIQVMKKFSVWIIAFSSIQTTAVVNVIYSTVDSSFKFQLI